MALATSVQELAECLHRIQQQSELQAGMHDYWACVKGLQERRTDRRKRFTVDRVHLQPVPFCTFTVEFIIEDEEMRKVIEKVGRYCKELQP